METDWTEDENENEIFVSPRTLRVCGRGILPQLGYPGDAGLDLFVYHDGVQEFYIRPGAFQDLPCGIAVEMPDGVWGMITGRSSTLRKRGLLVTTGIIDAGYRGELFCGVQNLGRETAVVRVGERLAQLILFQLATSGLRIERVEELSPSPRGTQGFGSTGV